MDWLSKIPNWIKIPIKVLLPALTIFSGIVMLSDDSFLERLNLLNMKKESGFVFGIMFLVCLSLIVSYIGMFLIERFLNKIQFIRYKKARIRSLELLSKEGMGILVQMYKTTSRTLELEISDGNVSILEGKEMIGRSSVSAIGMYFSYFMQPWVVQYFDNVIIKAKNRLNKISKLLKNERNDERKKELESEKADLEKCITNLTQKIEPKSISQQWFGY